MIQSGTDLADFLPKRVAWGIVIAVLLAVAIFMLPNLKFGSTGKKELDLADQHTLFRVEGQSKTELLQKIGPPTSINTKENCWSYDLPLRKGELRKSQIHLKFDATERCIKYVISI